MKVTTISANLPLPNEALLFDLEALYHGLQMVPDHRSRQGLRYPLASISTSRCAGQVGRAR